MRNTINSTVLALAIVSVGPAALAQDERRDDEIERTLFLQQLSAPQVVAVAPALIGTSVAIESPRADTISIRGSRTDVTRVEKAVRALDTARAPLDQREPVALICVQREQLEDAIAIAQELRSPDGRVMADRTTHCIVASDNSESLDRIRRVLGELDQRATLRRSVD